MLNELKFVQGAVSKKDFIPALTHVRIKDGKVRSYNGMLALSSPIALDLDITPKAEPLIKAISKCDETVTLSVTPTGRLSVKSGAFRALIECVQEETPHVMPEGEVVQINGEALIKGLEVLSPFIGDDASRPWANGVLLKGASAFATNNVCLLEYWIGTTGLPHDCNIPRMCVKEMLRIKEAPISAQVAANSITFHYSNERWIRTQLFSTEWPDLSKVLDGAANLQPIDDRIFTALENLKPFVDKQGNIYVNNGFLSTTIDPEEGAHYYIPDMQYTGVYNNEMLELLQGVVKSIDFSLYPKACLFQGDMLRGAIIGRKMA